MTENRWVNLTLFLYAGLVFAFIFAPVAASFVFSFNADRFPSLPLGGFSLRWYESIFNDPRVAEAFWNSARVGVIVSISATILGATAAYTDYRYRFLGKPVYLALALLPPTIPVVIMGLAMLAFLSRVGLSGDLRAVIISHIVMCTPFAMAVVRMRLAQMPADLEAAAWNLGAGQWRSLWHVVIPFALPGLLAALMLTLAVSFDEFAVAWFVSGFDNTVPVRILNTLQGQVSPQINAIGSIAFATTMTLVIIAQVVLLGRWRTQRRQADQSSGDEE